MRASSRTSFALRCTISAALVCTATYPAALAARASAAVNNKSPKADPAPAIVRTAKGTTEVGTLNGVAYRIDVPANWNRSLVVYFHGYSERMTTFHTSGGFNEATGPAFERGFAVAQSAYSAPGWATAEGVPESEALRQYFLRKYGTPRETFAIGVSMGGAILMETIETNPRPYNGALDLCGSVGSTYEAMQRRFAWRAAFDFYFPGLMPPLVPSPVDYQETPALKAKIAAALKANPAAAEALRNLTSLHTDADLMRGVSYFTFVLADMQRRSGGNPFDNRNYLYTGTNPTSTASDIALNDGVRRYAADEPARRYLVAHYTPTGRVTRPILALHTLYDPLVPGATLSLYAHQVEQAGYSENLVQQFVHSEGHCAFSPEQVGASFDELLDWVRTGRRPTPGILKVAPLPPVSRLPSQ